MKYYLLNWENKTKEGPVAYVELEDRPSYIVARTIFNIREAPFLFTVHHVLETKHGLVRDDNFPKEIEIWPDYMPNQFAWPLFSEKAKDIILNNISDKDQITWILAKVEFEKVVKPYYILQFNKALNLLNIDKTKFVQGTNAIIQPVFSKELLSDLTIFYRPATNDLWRITSSIYVSENLKKKLTLNKCTNIQFISAKVE
jgi:hypothetical protein